MPRTSSGSTPYRRAIPAATPPAHRSWDRQIPSRRTEAKKPLGGGGGGAEGGTLCSVMAPANRGRVADGIGESPDRPPEGRRGGPGSPWKTASGHPAEAPAV